MVTIIDPQCPLPGCHIFIQQYRVINSVEGQSTRTVHHSTELFAFFLSYPDNNTFAALLPTFKIHADCNHVFPPKTTRKVDRKV
jgi:hypothetical protein